MANFHRTRRIEVGLLLGAQGRREPIEHDVSQPVLVDPARRVPALDGLQADGVRDPLGPGRPRLYFFRRRSGLVGIGTERLDGIDAVIDEMPPTGHRHPRIAGGDHVCARVNVKISIAAQPIIIGDTAHALRRGPSDHALGAPPCPRELSVIRSVSFCSMGKPRVIRQPPECKKSTAFLLFVNSLLFVRKSCGGGHRRAPSAPRTAQGLNKGHCYPRRWCPADARYCSRPPGLAPVRCWHRRRIAPRVPPGCAAKQHRRRPRPWPQHPPNSSFGAIVEPPGDAALATGQGMAANSRSFSPRGGSTADSDCNCFFTHPREKSFRPSLEFTFMALPFR